MSNLVSLHVRIDKETMDALQSMVTNRGDLAYIVRYALKSFVNDAKEQKTKREGIMELIPKDRKIVFWVCPKKCNGEVQWNEDSTIATCLVCGEKSVTYTDGMEDKF